MRTGEISLTGTDLSKVRREVDDLLAALGGTVDREETTTAAKDGRVDRSLTSSTESAKDVTTEVIDTAEAGADPAEQPRAQQSHLADQTSMSTITMRLSTPAGHASPGALAAPVETA